MDSGARLSGQARGGAPRTGMADASQLTLAAPLKLVVWDLDESLWRGVLSEEEVELDPVLAEMVRVLNRRGIVSSICSKNDPQEARARLEQEGLWDEFVFPSIAWTPKGPRVAQIVADMQLRPPNVLFVDDNITNLQEALHFLPELQVADPGELAELLSLPQAKGKDDSRLTRLAQYRVLESKLLDRAASSISNEEFLRSCDIRVELSDAGRDGPERVLELVNRSNQLNFTKSRLSEQQLEALLAEDGRETRCVSVRDRYGEYGVCGFYSLREGRLSDFVFSCRILHMGVEQWLYARLGRPEIEIVGEVAASLDDPASVDWITVLEGGEGSTAAEPEPPLTATGRVLLKGGCDMWVLNSFLGGSITTEFTYTSPTGAEVNGHHCEIMRRSSKAELEEFGPIIERVPFLDSLAYRSRIARTPQSIGTLIYSALMEYTQGLYRLRDTDFVLPYGHFDTDATDPANWPYLEGRWGEVGVDREFLGWLSEHFEFEGAISEERFKDNIRWLAGRLPGGSRLIVMNGAEVPIEHPRELDRHLHHRHMNRVLEEVVAELGNTAICDVRPYVASREDLRDNLRHYTRQSYIRVAGHLAELVGSGVALEQRPLVRRLHRARRKLGRKLDHAALRLKLR